MNYGLDLTLIMTIEYFWGSLHENVQDLISSCSLPSFNTSTSALDRLESRILSDLFLGMARAVMAAAQRRFTPTEDGKLGRIDACQEMGAWLESAVPTYREVRKYETRTNYAH